MSNQALVIGADGLVGAHIVATLRSRGAKITVTSRRRAAPGVVALNVTDCRAVAACVAATAPTTVYLAAAAADVDACETHPECTRAVNVEGTAHVLDAAAAVGARVVAFSTDYVFDGATGAYREEDASRPLCEYGRQKLEMERLAVGRGALVLRTAVVYGFKPGGRTFVGSLLKRLQAGLRTALPFDQTSSPTYVVDLAIAAIELATAGHQGVLHVAGPSIVDRAAFGRAVATAFGYDPDLIEPLAAAALRRPAPRPARAGLLSERAQSLLPFALREPEAGLADLAQAT